MRKLIRVSLLAAALAAPAALAAQAAPHGAEAARRGPVARLLAHRAELGLTAEQVARLEGIEARLEETTRPLRERLRAARPARPERPRDLTPEQREARRESMRQHRPLVRELRESSRAAAREAHAVLTEAQVRKARELVRAQRQGPDRERPRGRPGRRGRARG